MRKAGGREMAGAALVLILTLAPLLRAGWIVSTTGADTPSNDYLFSIGLVDQVLSGTYHWSGFFRDTFIQGAHCMVFPILARLAVARLTGWNIYAELYLTLALFAARIPLLCAIISSRDSKPANGWLWVAVSALVFAVSQVEVFTYGDAGLQIGMVQLGFTLGLWGLLRFPGMWRGGLVAAGGGLLASWSGGGGLLAWPVLLLAAALPVGGGPQRTRRLLNLALIAGVMIASLLPYAFHSVSAGGSGDGVLAPDPLKMIGAIGYPLTAGIAATQTADGLPLALGLLGCALLGAGVALVCRDRDALGQAAVPSLLLLAWGVISIVATTMLRKGLLPWYTTSFLGFWIGLTGLAHTVWSNRAKAAATARGGQLAQSAPAAWPILSMTVLAALYLASNLTWEDKVLFFLRSRGPASASLVRHFDHAPTFAEELVFSGFELGNPTRLSDLARPLAKHRLGPFRQHQVWSLQGDFPLDAVKVREPRGSGDVAWSLNRGLSSASWWDYRHLDLLVPAWDVVVWQVDLPQNARSAVFQTQVLVEGGGTARIFVQRGNGPATEVISAGPATEGGGTEVLLPLMEPAGQKVTLVLTTTGAGRALFRYPVIDLYTNPGPETASVVRPENLDPMNLPPLPTTVDLLRGRPWKGVSGPLPRGGGQMLGPSEFMEMTEPLDRPASDFERLAVTVRVDPRVSPSALRVFFHMLNTSGEVTDPSVVLTLLPDGKSHVYTYPLKLLEADQRTLFRGMRLFSVSGGGPVEIQEVRLIPREASPAASAADTQ